MSETTIDSAVEVAGLETTPEVEVETAAAEVSALDVQLLRRLAEQARDQGLELTGEGDCSSS
jgi:hypothetical protein